MSSIADLYPPAAPAERAAGTLLSYSLPCPGVSPARFLGHARGGPRFFWASGRDDLALAGMGRAAELVAWGQERFATIEEQAQTLFADTRLLGLAEAQAGPRLFGGFAFAPDTSTDLAWADFPPAHLVLPHYQLTWARNRAWLTLNVNLAAGEDAEQQAAAMHEAAQAKIAELQEDPGTLAPPPFEQISYPLTPAEWARSIEETRVLIRAGALQKVVLSRFAEACFQAPADVEAALARLDAAYPTTYRFLFEPRPGSAFFGATPELLAWVAGDQATTMALAGSIRRGHDAGEDAVLAQELLASAKDLHEHQIVIDGIRARLAPLARELHVGATEVMALHNIQHLHTPISARLRQARGILPLAALLHPTPALGGEPREVAGELIARLEPFPRGWYAAPIGWIDHKLDGALSVAIRSAVAQQRRVWLYAGAGIVGDSDPAREWDETALKFRPMLEALAIR